MELVVAMDMRENIKRRIRLRHFSRICVLSSMSMPSQALYRDLQERVDIPIVLGDYDRSLGVNEKDLVLLETNGNRVSYLLTVLGEIQVSVPNASVCLFDLHLDDDIRHFLERSIVKGVFAWDTTTDLLVKGVAEIDSGSYWFSRKEFDAIANMRKGSNSERLCKQYGLTRREQQILFHLTEGHATAQIAKVLCLSKHTIKTHKNNLYKKLGVNSSEEAILLALGFMDGEK